MSSKNKIIIIIVFILVNILSIIYFNIKPTKVIICDKGYMVENNKCINKITIDANNNITCAKEYEVIGNKCIRFEIVNADEFMGCSDGFSAKNNICEKYIEPTKNYVCPSGYSYVDNNVCWKQVILENDIIYEPSGLGDRFLMPKCKTQNAMIGAGNICRKIETAYRIEKTVCIQGALINNKCYVTTNQQLQYSCLDGYELENNECKKTLEGKIYNNYSCQKGYQLDKDKCVKIKEGKVTIKYKCSKGKTLKNKICVR